jgi:Arc/MetJ-type ribon-helix-helix transcriptional regulator
MEQGTIMSADLSAESERFLRQAFERGVYPDRATAIDEAVELLKRRDRLRSDVRAGIEQADRGELLPADDVFRRLEERAVQVDGR